ncbi:uncharacterized protein LOC131937457 [Physella acuta]|uniref:uncharacterized protein LOC131937457 n=1 Tax=Physella acuta TaxID=109671 RepID=UPI0027DDBB30|nr:uncharacterized protein LOC131937457 [Physella acuta]
MMRWTLVVLVASCWTLSHQMTDEILDTADIDDLLDEISEDAEDSEANLAEVWTDILNAFKFLEEKQMEEEMKRLRDVSKRLPVKHHNFVRFGKRYNPTHSFVRFGRSGDEAKATGARKLDKRSFHSFVRFGRSDPAQSSRDSPARTKRDSDVTGIETDLVERVKPLDDVTSSDFLLKLISSGSFDRDTSSRLVLPVFKRRNLGTARIGRMPAVLFLNPSNKEPASAQGRTSSSSEITLPRYG